jgi:hypothetical protein
LQLSLFDEQHLAEVTAPAYPNERLIVCFNPVLAEERRRKREDLLQATERELARVAKSAARRTRKPYDDATLGIKVGKLLNHYKVGKHFAITITAGHVQWQRREAAIQEEARLDGFYVIRTSEARDRLSPEDAVRHYRRLAQVERAFRCLKGIDLLIRPIHHRHGGARPRAHLLVSAGVLRGVAFTAGVGAAAVSRRGSRDGAPGPRPGGLAHPVRCGPPQEGATANRRGAAGAQLRHVARGARHPRPAYVPAPRRPGRRHVRPLHRTDAASGARLQSPRAMSRDWDGVRPRGSWCRQCQEQPAVDMCERQPARSRCQGRRRRSGHLALIPTSTGYIRIATAGTSKTMAM